MNGSQFHQPTCCLGMRIPHWGSSYLWQPDVSLEEDWPHLSQDGFYTARPPLFLWPASCPLLRREWVSLARRNSQRKPDAVALNLLCGICINSLHNAVQPPSGLCHLWATPIISILVSSSSESRNIIFFVFRINKNEKCRSCSCLFSKISFFEEPGDILDL